MSVTCWLSEGLGLVGTGLGLVVVYAGMISVIVSIVCMVLGLKQLRKGDAKKAVAFALVGVIYSGVILAGIYIDDVMHTKQLEKDIAERNEEKYGEGWDEAPAIEGIPELYQEVLNKFYVAVRDQWPEDQLIDLAALSMAEYYGDASLDNVGFALMDVNSDGVDELVIGSTAPVEEGGTLIFCMYSDPENPYVNLSGVEGKSYYLHFSEENTYVAEIKDADAAWLLGAEEGSNMVDITYQEGALDPAGRLVLEMIPFAQYK
ncbi:MAG: hypothetical protein J6S45_03040 [Firmicutes bacterium]|nr:hypothetical protein [Bacillota bacterium]